MNKNNSAPSPVHARAKEATAPIAEPHAMSQQGPSKKPCMFHTFRKYYLATFPRDESIPCPIYLNHWGPIQADANHNVARAPTNNNNEVAPLGWGISCRYYNAHYWTHIANPADTPISPPRPPPELQDVSDTDHHNEYSFDSSNNQSTDNEASIQDFTLDVYNEEEELHGIYLPPHGSHY